MLKTHRLLRVWLAVVLALAAVSSDARIRFVRVTSPVYPLRADATGRTVVDSAGTPVPILGRNMWNVIGLSVVNYRQVLDDTQAKGFTAIETLVPTIHPGSVNTPRNGANQLPFLKRLDGADWNGSIAYGGNIATLAPDLTTPNEAYWTYYDTFLMECRNRGIAVILFPAYVGFHGTQEGWMAEMVANGATKAQTYGAFIANRYKGYKNIVWMLGGDIGTGDNLFTAPELAAEQGFITGLIGVSGQSTTLIAAEWRHPAIATDSTDFGSYITLNSTYNAATDVNDQGNRAFVYTPAKPSFMMESPFEGQADPVRQYGWWGTLSTRNGYVYGNVIVTDFSTGWQAALDSQGAQDAARLNTFVKSIAWSTLTPTLTAITAGGGTSIASSNYVACEKNTAGTLLIAYLPPAHTGSVTINMTVMTGTVTARWFDPTNGTYTTIGTFANTGTHAFTTTGNNSAGDADWILRLDA